jgi:hypothetical protein
VYGCKRCFVYRNIHTSHAAHVAAASISASIVLARSFLASTAAWDRDAVAAIDRPRIFNSFISMAETEVKKSERSQRVKVRRLRRKI